MTHLDEDISDQEVEEFKKETIKMFEEWTPKEFAEALYGNPHLSKESRLIMQIYLSDRPELKSEIENFEEEYKNHSLM